MDAPPIERAAAADAAAVLALLAENSLPVAGLLEHLPTTIVARQDGRVVGCAALEVYADGALLRSVAIAPALQHHGVGRSLTAAALQLAEDLKLPAVYLLTTTAERFFPKFGFERIERGAVPAAVQTSIEFTSACPSSATVMRKVL
jgi:amino-acid N-acetyltransferase